MFRSIRRLVGLFFLGVSATAIGGAIYALTAKRRMVPEGHPESDEVALVAIFEPLVFKSTSQAFRGGTLTCYYGGGMIDLREARLDPAGASLRMRTMFGGAQLVVPESWRVTTHVRSIFGGVGDSRPRVDRPDGSPHLTIEGLALFGGLGIASKVDAGADQWMQKMQQGRGRGRWGRMGA